MGHEHEDIVTAGMTEEQARENLNKTLAKLQDEAKAHGGRIAQMDEAVKDLRAAVRSVTEAAAMSAAEVANGPERELKRFVQPDGRVKLYGTVDEQGDYEAGLLDTKVQHGDWHDEFQRANEDLWLCALATSAKRNGRIEDIRDPSVLKRLAPRSWRKVQKLAKQAPRDIRGKILDDDTNTGGEFIPSEIRLPRLDQDALLDMETRLTGVFEVEPMSTGTVVNPFLDVGGVRPYIQGVPDSDDPPQYTASTPSTDERSRTAKTLAVRVLVAAEANEDSILDNMSVLRGNIVQTHALGVEDAIVNGDSTATHQDTGLSGWDIRGLWGSSGLGSTADHRRLWVGLRARATDVSNTTDGSGAMTYANTLADQAKLAAGHNTKDNMVLACSMKGYLTYILGMTELATVDKYGPQASVLSGEIGRVGMLRVVVSDLIDDQYNASGIYDDSTKTKTGVLLFNRTRFRIGRRRGALVEVDKDITRGVHNMVVTQRLIFYTIDGSSKKNVHWRYNL